MDLFLGWIERGVPERTLPDVDPTSLWTLFTRKSPTR